MPRGLRTGLAVLEQEGFLLLEIIEQSRNDDVAQRPQAGRGIQPVGTARVAGHEDQVTLRRAALAPLQVMRRPHRPAVLIGAKEAEVKIVTGILKVVRVAAK